MEVSRLYPSKNTIRNNSSIKYSVNCQSKIDTSNDTKDLLDIFSQIDATSSDYKLFKGLLEKKESIVIKIGSSKLKTEYEFGTMLKKLYIPTFIHFFCLFHCKDDFKSINTNTQILCKKYGKDTIHILVMPNIELGTIDNSEYKWNRDNFDVLKNVLKHITASLLYAHKETGFIHNDLHLGNIMLKKSRQSKISYGEFSSLDCMGIIPIIMDFDRSIIQENNFSLLYDKLQTTMQYIAPLNDIKINMNPVVNYLEQLIKKKSMPTKDICNKIYDTIDKITIRHLTSEIPQMPNWSKF